MVARAGRGPPTGMGALAASSQEGPPWHKLSWSSSLTTIAEEPEFKHPANIRWIMEKAREFQKNIYFCFIDYAKAFDCVDHNKLWKMFITLLIAKLHYKIKSLI